MFVRGAPWVTRSSTGMPLNRVFGTCSSNTTEVWLDTRHTATRGVCSCHRPVLTLTTAASGSGLPAGVASGRIKVVRVCDSVSRRSFVTCITQAGPACPTAFAPRAYQQRASLIRCTTAPSRGSPDAAPAPPHDAPTIGLCGVRGLDTPEAFYDIASTIVQQCEAELQLLEEADGTHLSAPGYVASYLAARTHRQSIPP
jgi:hypothetical protein